MSDPFLLKHLKNNVETCVSPMNSSFDQGKFEEYLDEEEKGSCYDDELMKSFLGGVEKDDDIIVNPE